MWLWTFIFFNIFTLPSIILYVIIMFLMVRERSCFSPVFVRLWILFAIANLTSFIAVSFFNRWPNTITNGTPEGDILEDFPFPVLLRIGHFVCDYSIYCQNILCLFLVANRLKAIAFPLAATFWEQHFWKSTTILLLSPLVVCVPLLYEEAKFYYLPPLDGYVLRSIHKKEEISDLFEFTVFQCIIAFLAGIMNITSVILLYRRSMNDSFRRERNLFLMAFLCFLFQMSLAMLSFLLALYHSNGRVVSVVHWLRPFVTDCFTLGMPYFTLLLNLHIRKCFQELPFIRIFCSSPLKQPLINQRDSVVML